MESDTDTHHQVAIFAAGCFWSPEAMFRRVDGVLDATVGYTGGTVKNPGYRAVCTGRTGHAEAVRVVFDPARVTYTQLLDVFWRIHDPTTLNRQGFDVGSQYRSAIFYLDEHQRAAAEESKRALDASGQLGRPIVTQIAPASEFYRAEEYHQRYYDRMGVEPACGIGGCGAPEFAGSKSRP